MDRRVQVVINLMKDDLSREVHIDEIAMCLNISPSRLRYIFKVETGHSPAQYLKNLRMQMAKHLIETTFLNVKQIICELGIKDESHFVRDFKRVFGMTITQYRQVCDSNFKNMHAARREQADRLLDS